MQRVARLSDIPADRGLAVRCGDTELLLLRHADAIHAFAARCPHAGAPLAEGAVCDGALICPWHKARFATADGGLLDPPALTALARYPVRIDGDWVFAAPEPIAATPPSATHDPRRMLIVGAGAAGTAAALALRDFGFTGAIQLVGREPGLPYDRTALSKFVTSGEMPAAEVPALQGTERFAATGIELIQAEVTALDPRARTATLADGRTLAYDAALLAPGADPVRPAIPGIDLPGVHVLRSRADAAALTERLPGRVVILGSSFIALEVASGLRRQDIAVDIVAPEPIPFAHLFGPEIGAMFKTLHGEHQVTFHQARPTAIDGAGGTLRVALDRGDPLPADLVLIATGVRPATDFVPSLAKSDDGAILVDATLSAAPGLWVAGDSARFPFAGTPTRIEHWRLAQQHARIAARNMLGGSETYAGVPFFWTYHYGKRFEYLGHPAARDQTLLDGDLATLSFIALFAQHGQLVAALGCNRERDMARLHDAMLRPLPLPAARELLGM